MAKVDCGAILGEIDAIVHEPEFVTQCKDFVNSNCDVFTEDTEYKLEYTPIHEEYMSVVEGHIEKRLAEVMGPDFSMETFMAELPAFLGQKNSSGGDEAHSSTIEFLMGFGEIDSFKDMMLVAKKDKNNSSNLESADKVQFSAEHQKRDNGIQVISEARSLCKELVGNIEDANGWKVVTDKPWIKLERKETANGKGDFLRTTMELDIPAENAMEMICKFTPERAAWDSMMKNSKTLKEYNGPDDVAVSYTVELPMAKPRDQHSRIIISRDFPAPGAQTYMYLEIDPVTDDIKPAAEALGAGSIFPIEGQPNKCLLRGVDQLEKGWIPRFIMNWIISTWFPKQMTGQVIKYKKAKGMI